jgi:predicted metalloendopeptidase
MAVAALTATAPSGPAPAGAANAAHGIDLAGMDRSIAPGDDFFGYANGTWLRTTAIPPDRSSYGVGSALIELTRQRTAGLIQDAANASAAPGSDARRIGDYYAGFMDEAGIEKRGLAPLQATLDRIAAIQNRQDLARVLGGTLRADVDALNSTNFHTENLFGLWVAQSLDDPSRYEPFLLQGGLGMPDREYYLSTSRQMVAVRGEYQAHIARVLALAHVPDDKTRAPRIFDLELRIAQAHWSRVASEDVTKANNHWSRKEFEAHAPGIDWHAYFTAAGLDHEKQFVVWQPSAVTGIAALVGSQPLEVWKDYLTFHAIESASPFLPKAFVEERFAFYGKTLTGALALRERWKRGVDAVSDALGEAVGKIYVQHYFPAAEKARAEAMVRNLLAAFGQRIDHLEWMSSETRTKAKAKLATLRVGVGYPDKWLDYSGLEVVRGDALGNFERAELYHYRRELAKLGRPVDRDEWVMTPQTVNAVNLPAMNALNFPAAMLQPPYFDPNRPVVMDYGAMGATIGHEISHSFDDEGALFDASGRLKNWWTPADFAHFRAASAHLVQQFSKYRPLSDLAVNGQQTLSENIADVAGLAVAYDAYRLALQGAPAPAVAGLSGEQQFFLSYAQSWREKYREPALREIIVSDGHAPDQYRADTVRNLDQWYGAFDVRPGQKLYLAPESRVRMW